MYVDRIEKLEQFADKTVSLDEFIAFQYFLEDIDVVKNHVKAYRTVSKETFKGLIDQFHKEKSADGTLNRN